MEMKMLYYNYSVTNTGLNRPFVFLFAGNKVNNWLDYLPLSCIYEVLPPPP